MSEIQAKLLNAMLESLKAQEQTIKKMNEVITEILKDEISVTNMTYEKAKEIKPLKEIT